MVNVNSHNYGFSHTDANTSNYAVVSSHYNMRRDFDENLCLKPTSKPDFYLLDGRRFMSLEETVMFIAAAYDSDTQIYLNLSQHDTDTFIELMRMMCEKNKIKETEETENKSERPVDEDRDAEEGRKTRSLPSAVR